jgi:hypothetical protein
MVGNSATSNDWVSFGRWRQLFSFLWVRYCASSLHHVTINKWYKMVDNDVSFRQRAVIEFLVKEEIPAAAIHYRLQRVYKDVCMGADSVRRWIKHFKDGNTSIQDQSRSCCPRTASTESTGVRLDWISGTWKTINAVYYVQTLLKLRRALGDKRPGRKVNTTTLDLTLLFCPWKKLRTWCGKFSLTLRTVLIWYPPLTISLVLWKISCEVNSKRRRRHSRQLCVKVFGQLERSSTVREYSNFQNGGKNLYREAGII